MGRGGDIAACAGTGDEATAAVVTQIPGTVFALGQQRVRQRDHDSSTGIAYDPSVRSVQGFGRWPTPGDHEVRELDASRVFPVFRQRGWRINRGYYAYDVGTWRIYALNSNCADIGGCNAGSPEEAWLAADLAAHPAVCIAAMWHHPQVQLGIARQRPGDAGHLERPGGCRRGHRPFRTRPRLRTIRADGRERRRGSGGHPRVRRRYGRKHPAGSRRRSPTASCATG